MDIRSGQDVRLLRNDPDHRYEIWLGDERAGIATYRETEDHVTFVHTIVDKAFGGQGFASRLAAFALQDTVDRGKRIVPVCPFIAEYLQSHHEFDDRVDFPKAVRS